MVHTEGENDRLEIWKDIKDYENLYQGSNWGRVKSLDRWVKDTNGSLRFYKGRILKPGTNTCGYLQVSLYKNGKEKIFYVHRLVAEAFIPNPNNLPEVNHRDENKQNNSVENLEWCDRLYNVRYGTGIERQKKKQLNNIKTSKTVVQYTLDGKFIREWKSTAECGRNGYNQRHVSECCKGKIKKHKNFIWKYK